MEVEDVLEGSQPVLRLHECCQSVWGFETAAVAGHLLGTRWNPQGGSVRCSCYDLDVEYHGVREVGPSRRRAVYEE